MEKLVRRINDSKKHLAHVWRKWYEQGMVAQKEYPPGSLTIGPIGINLHAGRPTGYIRLTLGMEEYKNGWRRPLVHVVVKGKYEEYKDIKVLEKIPPHAIPFEIFFSKTGVV